jgi:dTDP-4-amino-4,6-dideoxygalactose transaminase
MKIPFEKEFKEEYFNHIEEIFESGFWSEGAKIKEFEENFSKFCNLQSLAVNSGGAGLLALYEYVDVKGSDVIVPANTFWATTVAAKKAGANIIYADCNKYDLCISLEDLKKKITPRTKAITVVHIGGHIAFDIEEIAAFCAEHGIALIEDCAHAHGASLNGKTPGSWGVGGVYSFYATKTMPIGEGGMVVSKDKKFIEWLRLFRNYGKSVVGGKVTYHLENGFNFRMSEFIAALGLVQLKRLPMILDWKKALAVKYDQIFSRRVELPAGMESGYYKYIVFDYCLREETGQVFGENDLGYRIENMDMSLPNTDYIVQNHSCVPIWYGWPKFSFTPEELGEVLLEERQ